MRIPVKQQIQRRRRQQLPDATAIPPLQTKKPRRCQTPARSKRRRKESRRDWGTKRLETTCETWYTQKAVGPGFPVVKCSCTLQGWRGNDSTTPPTVFFCNLRSYYSLYCLRCQIFLLFLAIILEESAHSKGERSLLSSIGIARARRGPRCGTTHHPGKTPAKNRAGARRPRGQK